MADKWIPSNMKPAYAFFGYNRRKCFVIEGYGDYVWLKFDDQDEPESYKIGDINFKPCLDGA